MKLCRNELLLMGGMYQILAFVFALFNTELSAAMIGVICSLLGGGADYVYGAHSLLGICS